MATALFPVNLPDSLYSLALLSDEICFLAGQRDTDINWYLKRGAIATIYTSTEIFWLTDDQEGFEDTWKFLDDRMDDALVAKSIWEETFNKFFKQ